MKTTVYACDWCERVIPDKPEEVTTVDWVFNEKGVVPQLYYNPGSSSRPIRCSEHELCQSCRDFVTRRLREFDKCIKGFMNRNKDAARRRRIADQD